MDSEKLAAMNYEEKEKRLDEILSRLDKSETLMDQLAAEAKEAAQLISSMQATLRNTKAELTIVFSDMNQHGADV